MKDSAVPSNGNLMFLFLLLSLYMHTYSTVQESQMIIFFFLLKKDKEAENYGYSEFFSPEASQ